MSSARPLVLCASRSRSAIYTLIHPARRSRLPSTQPFKDLQSCRHNSTHYLPTILQPRFWRTLWPKTRSSQPNDTVTRPKTNEWNPATFFIVILLLIGSQSIHMIQLRRDFDKFSQQTETKLSLLREVVRRFQNGEDVDVAKELGTGDEVKEKEWEEVMRELQEEDDLIQRLQQKRRNRKAAAKEKAKREGSEDNKGA